MVRAWCQLFVALRLGSGPCSPAGTSSSTTPSTPPSSSGGGSVADCSKPGTSGGYEQCQAHPECQCQSQIITCDGGGWVTQYSLVPGTCQAASATPTTSTPPYTSPNPHKPPTRIDPPKCENPANCYFNNSLADCLNKAYDDERTCKSEAQHAWAACINHAPKATCNKQYFATVEGCLSAYDKAVDQCGKSGNS